jgi:hypothetical protein
MSGTKHGGAPAVGGGANLSEDLAAARNAIAARLNAASAAASAAASGGGRTPFPPRLGLILGSGLGGFADGLSEATAIDYADIPGFPEIGRASCRERVS